MGSVEGVEVGTVGKAWNQGILERPSAGYTHGHMSAGIRKPGGSFELTDEELMHAPARLLTREQRRRRRQLRNNVAKAKSREIRKKRIDEGRGKVVFCQGFTKKGEPCQAYAITGVKHCGNHLNDAEQAKLGRPRQHQIATEGRLKATAVGGVNMSAPAMARATMEVALEKLLSRYYKALGLEFAGFDETGAPVVYDHGMDAGIRLHGESKEGYIEMSQHPDMLAQIQVIEKLWDRVYGKPRQTTVLEGGTKPIQVKPVRSAERSQQVAALLQRTGALPHEGRTRRRPVDAPAQPSAEDPYAGGRVVPLKRGSDE